MAKSFAHKAAAKKAHSTYRKLGPKAAPKEGARYSSQDRRSIRGIRSRCANARVNAHSRREERSSDARAL